MTIEKNIYSYYFSVKWGLLSRNQNAKIDWLTDWPTDWFNDWLNELLIRWLQPTDQLNEWMNEWMLAKTYGLFTAILIITAYKYNLFYV